MDKEIATGETYVAVEDIRTHMYCEGAGPPLVLVHGLGGPLMWSRLIGPLSSSFRVIVLDLPGFGDSSAPSRKFTTDEYAKFIHAFLDEVGIKKAFCAGVSYGGQIAVNLAAQYPERIEKLILIASTGLSKYSSFLLNPIAWGIFSTIATYGLLRSQWLLCRLGKLSFYKIERRPPGLCGKYYQQLSRKGNRDAWLNVFKNIYMPDTDFLRKLSTVRTPTLVVWGENDRIVSPECSEKFCRALPSSSLLMFPECAHSVPLERPQELADAIVSFAGNS